MSSRSIEWILCHSDIHLGNLFIDQEGNPFIVDWDYPWFAPKERDLMFIGGGRDLSLMLPNKKNCCSIEGMVQHSQTLSLWCITVTIENCFACVQRHLADDGRFLIEVFNSSVRLLARESGRRYPVGQYADPKAGSQVFVTEEVRYDSASQINHIQWFFRNEGSNQEMVLSFEMRQFFLQEMDVLLLYNDFLIEHKYGNYNEEKFSSEAWKQLIICRPK